MIKIWLALVLTLSANPGFAGENFKQKLGGLEEVEAKPDKALVYIIRPAAMGKAVRVWTFSGQEPLTVTHGRQGSFHYLEPGNHLLWSRAENVAVLELELEAGKTYWIKQRIEMGFGKARTKLVLLSQQEGRQAMTKCKRVELTDAGRIRATEIVAKKWQVAQKKQDN